MSGKAPFHNLISVAVSFALMTALAVTTAAQNAVPPTARQAAMMPAFNSRLAHPTMSHMPARPPARSRFRFSPGRPLDNNILYDNGPVNGEVDAWTINFGFAASDTIQGIATISGIQFWAWLEPGDTITNVEVQIGSNGYFSNDLFDGVVTLTQSNCFTNNFGFDVCLVSGNFTGPNLGGNDWVTLANANTAEGNPVYWDENSGVGCQSPGCPSLAQENTIGTIPSEAFTIAGAGGADCSYGSQMQDIYRFNGAADGENPSGVVVDRAGNLEGTTSQGGNNGAGTAFRLTPEGSSWVFTSLYNFVGGNNGGNPGAPLLGPNQTLYGLAWSVPGSGLIYNLTPTPTVCGNVMCSWRENLLYSFPADPGNTALSGLDRAGNLYGFVDNGGAYGAGTILQFTPALGGWTENTIYTFTGGTDGSGPNGLVVGIDGNLYGTTSAGGASGLGTIFQLVPSQNGWTENVLYAFAGGVWGEQNPSSIAQDTSGNFYVSYSIQAYNLYGPETDAGIDEGWLSPAGQWEHRQIARYSPYTWDAEFEVYGLVANQPGNPAFVSFAYCWSCYPQQLLWYGVGFLNDAVALGANAYVTGMVEDAQGNLYGGRNCSYNGQLLTQGTIWKMTPQ